nr:unnamed protein product [Digitaria exilis]
MEMTHMFPREGASSSSTSMSSQRSETDDDRMIAMVLSEEYAKLDGAMAKRLTNLTSIPVRCLITFMSFVFLCIFLFFHAYMFPGLTHTSQHIVMPLWTIIAFSIDLVNGVIMSHFKQLQTSLLQRSVF